MKSEEWKTYRTRFLVNAKQLSSTFSFIDHLGRQHLGRKGDYLVESSDGVLSIAPRRIFEDIYVSISEPHPADNAETLRDSEESPRPIPGQSALDLRSFAALEIQDISARKPPTRRQPINGPIPIHPCFGRSPRHLRSSRNPTATVTI